MKDITKNESKAGGRLITAFGVYFLGLIASLITINFELVDKQTATHFLLGWAVIGVGSAAWFIFTHNGTRTKSGGAVEGINKMISTQGKTHTKVVVMFLSACQISLISLLVLLVFRSATSSVSDGLVAGYLIVVMLGTFGWMLKNNLKHLKNLSHQQ